MYVQTTFPLVRNFDLEGVDQGLPFLGFASPFGRLPKMCKMVCKCVYVQTIFYLVRNFDPEGVDLGLPIPFIGFASPFGTQDVQNVVLVCVCSDHFPFSHEF